MDVEIEQPEAAHHSHGGKGYMAAVPLLALVISLISIAVAYHHGKVMESLVHQNERLVQANSLPYVQLYGSNVGPSGEPRLAFVAANEGVGPAHIKSAQVLVKGKPVRDLDELMQACCSVSRQGIINSTLRGAMIRPGEAVHYIDAQPSRADEASVDKLDQARKSDLIETRVCYCSVFKECWTRSSAGTAPLEPQPVSACPTNLVQYRD